MNKPTLLVMAAGMGSRYGGLKQFDTMDDYGHIIIDFSLYDAHEAGFNDVVFIIKKELEQIFKDTIGKRASKYMNVKYVYQELDNIPEGFSIPEGRIKPFGTGHAILCAKDVIDGPVAVINADDYYGKEAFKLIYDYLLNNNDDKDKYNYTMVGYLLRQTVSENGTVSRGVCECDEDGYLTNITERTKIASEKDGIRYFENETWNEIDSESIVSMNLWGFSKSIFNELEKSFLDFFKNDLPNNPLKGEFFLPTVVNNLIKNNKAQAKVLKSADKWFGVTYKEDKQSFVEAVKTMKAKGLYPDNF